MKLVFMRTGWLLLAASIGLAQEVIPLYPGAAPGSAAGNYPEKQYFSRVWNTEVVSNVTTPTLTLYRPIAGGNGTAVRFGDRKGFDEYISKTQPLSIADGIAAVAYVRKHAYDWGVLADRVGIVGFSAGGTVTAGAGLRYTPESRPAFVAPIYAALSLLKDDPVPVDAPPMFLAAATDDRLGLAPDSIILYNKWTAAHKPAELHMYAIGGHGFGMKKQGYPSDEWIERFADWLRQNGWMKR